MAGELLSRYRQSLVEDLIQSIAGNTSIYYAYASNPTLYSNGVPQTTLDDYSTLYENGWNLLFGKKIANTDVASLIKRYDWESNTVYLAYDDRVSFANTGNSSFYVSTPPPVPGGYFHVYKCIDNANGAPSTIIPDLRETYSFTLADGYTWRYIYSISSSNFAKFGNDDYLPAYPNNQLLAAAYNYSGIDKVVITNTGQDYIRYHSGNILSIVNTSVVQLSANASATNDFYVDSSIYIYNTESSGSQLKRIIDYNGQTKRCFIEGTLNTDLIIEENSNYIISPTVSFDTDGNESPQAYSVINTQSNSISKIVIIDTGFGISRGTVTITAGGRTNSTINAIARCIVPPPGGHGSNPATELYTSAICITSSFVDTEGNNIVTVMGNSSTSANLTFNKIGIIKDPYEIQGVGEKGTIQFSSNTFDQIFKADLNPDLATAFVEDSIVTGQVSGAKGKVVFCNTSQIYMVGDKHFVNNEILINANGVATSNINILHRGDIYAKEFRPLYVENVSDVTRTDEQSETFKIIIRI